MQRSETYLGEVQDVSGTTVAICMSKDSLTGFVYINGQGYRAGQIGSFVRIPIGFENLYGIIGQVGASAVPDSKVEEKEAGNRWITIQLIGEAPKNGVFQRGLSQYPTIGDEVHLVSESELNDIYGQPDKPYFVRVGHVSNAESIPALIDVNKLLTRHSAVMGTTGSGKSTTVSSLISSLADTSKYPSSRVLMLDLHGEYARAMQDKADVFQINPPSNKSSNVKKLVVPFWALNFDELCEISFGDFNNEKDRNLIMEEVQKYKLNSLHNYPRTGAAIDELSVESPIPFCLHQLWYDLYLKTFGTYYSEKGKEKPLENLAYELDENGQEIKGNSLKGIPPVFKNINTAADAVKINQTPTSRTLNIGKQLQLLGSKLRIPRYNFIFNPDGMTPDTSGYVDNDIDNLLSDWIGGDNPISILDLSGVPSDILQTTIGAVLRILYEALFWSRNLSVGARERPLLVVMEEAHIYLNKNSDNMASRVVQRIVKEGRKYGIGAMIVSQRPSEIDTTVLSQCGTFFALRLSNSTDRSHISSAVSDNLDGLTSMLPILRTGEAIILGEAVKLPMRTTIKAPPKNKRPDSQDPVVYDEASPEESTVPGGWGISKTTNEKYDEMAEAWRSQNVNISRLRKE